MGIKRKKKEIVILARSRKHSAYCIAGIDCDSKNLVRIITNNEDNHYAVKKEEIEDDKGKVAVLYDNIVIVVGEDKINIPHQPENIMLDTNYYISNKGRYSKDDLRELIDLLSNKYDYIFYNDNNYLSQNEIDQINEKDRHSLEIINPQYLIIRVKDNKKKTLTGSIKYNGIWYNNLSITDKEFESEYYDEVSNNIQLRIDNPYILVSLGEEFNSNYYKLIACILDIK